MILKHDEESADSYPRTVLAFLDFVWQHAEKAHYVTVGGHTHLALGNPFGELGEGFAGFVYTKHYDQVQVSYIHAFPALFIYLLFKT